MKPLASRPAPPPTALLDRFVYLHFLVYQVPIIDTSISVSLNIKFRNYLYSHTSKRQSGFLTKGKKIIDFSLHYPSHVFFYGLYGAATPFFASYGLQFPWVGCGRFATAMRAVSRSTVARGRNADTPPRRVRSANAVTPSPYKKARTPRKVCRPSYSHPSPRLAEPVLKGVILFSVNIEFEQVCPALIGSAEPAKGTSLAGVKHHSAFVFPARAHSQVNPLDGGGCLRHRPPYWYLYCLHSLDGERTPPPVVLFFVSVSY